MDGRKRSLQQGVNRPEEEENRIVGHSSKPGKSRA
jgi:hypothetical protein